MTVQPRIVLSRLAHLGHVLAQLDRLRELPATARCDAVHELAAERALQVAAEVILDLGHHILAGRGHKVPATYREVIPALAKAGVLTSELAERLDGLAGLRNILVHDYADVDVGLLWRLIDDRLADLHAAHRALASIPELAR